LMGRRGSKSLAVAERSHTYLTNNQGMHLLSRQDNPPDYVTITWRKKKLATQNTTDHRSRPWDIQKHTTHRCLGVTLHWGTLNVSKKGRLPPGPEPRWTWSGQSGEGERNCHGIRRGPCNKTTYKRLTESPRAPHTWGLCDAVDNTKREEGGFLTGKGETGKRPPFRL